MRKNKHIPKVQGEPWKGCLSPFSKAKIAIKSLKTGNVQQVAQEYGVEVNDIKLLQDILEDNAMYLYLTDTEESLNKLLSDARGQLESLSNLFDNISEIIKMRSDKYFSE
jgi:hypothetical protein